MRNEESALTDPIFVMGTGRCGLTPLMHLISYHKDLAWPSQYHERFPDRYKVSYLSRILDLPFFASKVKYWRFVPRHSETYRLWNNQFHGFARPFRDLVGNDLTKSVKGDFRHAASQIKKYQGKKRFIAEYSGWSRIDFMRAIFPDAQFIHVVRDGRAVANSFINVNYWRGWEGIYKWRWGVPKEDLLRKLEKYNYSFLALAGVHWKILINNILEKSTSLPKDNILVVRYEDLVEEPEKVAYKCLVFLGLDTECRKFKKHLSTVRIVNANKYRFRIPAWRDNISEKQEDMLNDLLEEELVRFGYL